MTNEAAPRSTSGARRGDLPSDAGLYQAVLDSMPAHVAILDDHGEILYVNAAWRRFAVENGTPEQVPSCLAGNYFEILERARDQGEIGAEAIAQGFEKLARREIESTTHEYPCHSPEEPRWFLVTGSRIRGAAGSGIAVVHVNITDRILAEIAARDHERQIQSVQADTLSLLRAFAATLPDLVFVMNADGTFRHCLSTATFLAIPEDQFLGKNVREVFPGRLGERFAHSISRAASSTAPQSMRYQMAVPYPDGEVRDFEVRFFSPDPGTVFTVVRDTTELSQTVRALEESDERFRSFFESSWDGIVISDLEDRILDANPAYCSLLGYDRDELLAMTIRDIQAPECRRSAVGAIRAELLRNEVFETVDIRKDGTRVEVEVATGWLKGRTDRAISTVRDITERRKNERRLRILDHAIEQSTASVVITNAEGIIEYANESTVRNTGYSREELIGSSPRVLKSGWTGPEGYRDLWRTIRSGHDWVGEFYNRRKDGTFYWEQAIISPIRDGAGTITHFVAVKDDITERKRFELSLRESEERFQQLARHIDQGFWMSDALSTRTLYVSPGYERIWGRSSQELLADALLWLGAVHQEDRERVRQSIATRHLTGVYDEEYRVVRPDGTTRWVNDRAYPVLDDAGQTIRLAGIVTDITDQKGAQDRELASMRREAAVGRIAAAVAHEVNNPLGTMKFLLRSLRKATQGAEAPGELEMLEGQVDRITNTVRALLGFSRQRGAKNGLFAAGEVLTSVIDLFRGGLDARGIAFSAAVADDLPAIAGDITAFQEIIINLLENAREILKAGDAVRVSATMEQDVLAVVVADSGPGLGPNPEHHFAPYVTARTGGTGLGLALARRVCEASGGSLRGENGPDGGAVFTIRLPVQDQGSERRITIRKSELGELV